MRTHRKVAAFLLAAVMLVSSMSVQAAPPIVGQPSVTAKETPNVVGKTTTSEVKETPNVVGKTTETKETPNVVGKATTEAKETPNVVTTEASTAVTTETTTEITTEAAIEETEGREPEEEEVTKTLLMEAPERDKIPKNANIIDNIDDMYLISFDTQKEAIKAYEEYGSGKGSYKASINTSFRVATEISKTKDTPNDILDENVFSNIDTEPKSSIVRIGNTETIALIDSGVPQNQSNVEMTSVLSNDEGVDGNGHGTVMLETIRNINPNVKVLSIKAIDDTGFGDAASVYAAIEYAIERKVSIINLSLSGDATEGNLAIESAIQDAVNAGIRVIGAAGNNGNDAKYYVPGSIRNVIVLGACDSLGNRIFTSNYGPSVDYFGEASSTSEATAKFSATLALNDGDIGKTELKFFKNEENFTNNAAPMVEGTDGLEPAGTVIDSATEAFKGPGNVRKMDGDSSSNGKPIYVFHDWMAKSYFDFVDANKSHPIILIQGDYNEEEDAAPIYRSDKNGDWSDKADECMDGSKTVQKQTLKGGPSDDYKLLRCTGSVDNDAVQIVYNQGDAPEHTSGVGFSSMGTVFYIQRPEVNKNDTDTSIDLNEYFVLPWVAANTATGERTHLIINITHYEWHAAHVTGDKGEQKSVETVTNAGKGITKLPLFAVTLNGEFHFYGGVNRAEYCESHSNYGDVNAYVKITYNLIIPDVPEDSAVMYAFRDIDQEMESLTITNPMSDLSVGSKAFDHGSTVEGKSYKSSNHGSLVITKDGTGANATFKIDNGKTTGDDESSSNDDESETGTGFSLFVDAPKTKITWTGHNCGTQMGEQTKPIVEKVQTLYQRPDGAYGKDYNITYANDQYYKNDNVNMRAKVKAWYLCPCSKFNGYTERYQPCTYDDYDGDDYDVIDDYLTAEDLRDNDFLLSAQSPYKIYRTDLDTGNLNSTYYTNQYTNPTLSPPAKTLPTISAPWDVNAHPTNQSSGAKANRAWYDNLTGSENPKHYTDGEVGKDRCFLYTVYVPRMDYTYTFNENLPASAATRGQHATNMPDNITRLAENTVGSPNRTPKLHGYVFLGWSYSPSGPVNFNSAEIMYSNKTIYAIWRPMEYYVIYDANGGTNFDHYNGEYTQNVTSGTTGGSPHACSAGGTGREQKFQYDTPGTIAACGYQRAGFNFICWNTTPAGNDDHQNTLNYTTFKRSDFVVPAGEQVYYGPPSYSNLPDRLGLEPVDQMHITVYAQWNKVPGTETLTVVSEETGNPVPNVTVTLHYGQAGTQNSHTIGDDSSYNVANWSPNSSGGVYHGWDNPTNAGNYTLTTNAAGQITVGDLLWYDYQWQNVSVPEGYLDFGWDPYNRSTLEATLGKTAGKVNLTDSYDTINPTARNGRTFFIHGTHLSELNTRVLYMKHVKLTLNSTIRDIYNDPGKGLIKGENPPAFMYHISGTDVAGVAHEYNVMVQTNKDLTPISGQNLVPDMFAGTYQITQIPVSRYEPLTAINNSNTVPNGINATANIIVPDSAEATFPYQIKQYGGFGAVTSATNHQDH